ncbi:hypothetical protein AXG93_2022s1030 [Marchantia polymorpha subsp. ruderalis]|uniref:Uncharacterized protein n=1 Tax=Marchantia polymorpha subsp. ruderalis TaxID=1480154 RepID=A0A176VZ69_MARPO|nr:hypothetical protein AXG93_2022s1030 [Marchantia polymorpha subsp. ruderalis]
MIDTDECELGSSTQPRTIDQLVAPRLPRQWCPPTTEGDPTVHAVRGKGENDRPRRDLRAGPPANELATPDPPVRSFSRVGNDSSDEVSFSAAYVEGDAMPCDDPLAPFALLPHYCMRQTRVTEETLGLGMEGLDLSIGPLAFGSPAQKPLH